MNDWKDLIEKVAKKAAEEGLLGDTGSDMRKDLLPRPRQASLESSLVNVLKSVAGNIEQVPHPTQNEEVITAIVSEVPQEKPTVSRAETIAKADIIIQEQLDYLESWTNINLSEARKDWWRFWVFKLPALISTVSITAFESFGYGKVVIILGVVSALCVGIDAAFPGGQLYNVHKQAANEARRLQHDILTKWRQVQFDESRSINGAIKIIMEEVQSERTRIDKYVTDAEASLGKSRTSNSQ
jgi:hypothetical protein